MRRRPRGRPPSPAGRRPQPGTLIAAVIGFTMSSAMLASVAASNCRRQSSQASWKVQQAHPSGSPDSTVSSSGEARTSVSRNRTARDFRDPNSSRAKGVFSPPSCSARHDLTWDSSEFVCYENPYPCNPSTTIQPQVTDFQSSSNQARLDDNDRGTCTESKRVFNTGQGPHVSSTGFGQCSTSSSKAGDCTNTVDDGAPPKPEPESKLQAPSGFAPWILASSLRLLESRGVPKTIARPIATAIAAAAFGTALAGTAGVAVVSLLFCCCSMSFGLATALSFTAALAVAWCMLFAALGIGLAASSGFALVIIIAVLGVEVARYFFRSMLFRRISDTPRTTETSKLT